MNEETEMYKKGYAKGYSTAKNKYLSQVKALKKEYETQIHDVCSTYPFNLIQDVIEDREMNYHFSIKQIEKVMLERLSERENNVLQMRYARNMSLEEVGKEQCVTRERVRQIEAKSIRKLRNPAVLKEMSVIPYGEYMLVKQELEITQKKLELANENLNRIGFDAVKSEDVADFFDKGIEEFNLSHRTYNCLARNGIKQIKDAYDVWQKNKTFMMIRNLGKKSENELISLFKENGIELEK